MKRTPTAFIPFTVGLAASAPALASAAVSTVPDAVGVPLAAGAVAQSSFASLVSGVLMLVLAALLCRSFGLFRRFRRPSSRALCLLAAALVLNAGAITARSKGFYRPRLVHFADEPADGTVAEVAAILDQSNPTLGDVFASRTTVEALLADEGLFSSIFGCQFHDDSPPFVYIEGGTHDAGDLAPLFEKYGGRIEAWVRDGGRLLVNASPPSGRCELPFGAALVGGEGSSCAEPIAYYQQPFYLAPSLLHGASAVANSGDRLSDGRIDIDAIMYDFWADGGTGLRVYPDIAPSAIGFIAPTNALGSVMYSSLLGPSHFHMEESYLETVDDPQTWQTHTPKTTFQDGTTLWSRLLYWAFRNDGLHSFWSSQMDGDLFVTGGFSIQAGYPTEAEVPIYLFTRGRQIDNVAVSECDWLSVPDESADTTNLTPSILVSLSDAAADLSPGVYTGSVVVANATSFDPPRGNPGFDPTPLYNLMDYPWSPFPSAQRHWFILTVGDPPPYAGTFRIAEGGIVTAAEGGVARFTVVRESADLPAATVRLRTEDHTARAGVDFVYTWLTLDFPEGVATNVVEIPVIDNTVLHTYRPASVAPRDFLVRLFTPSAGASIDDAHAVATVSIADDELVPHSWFVRPAFGGWEDADIADFRAMLAADGTLPSPDVLSETTFEDADPEALFGPASDCVFLAFGPREVEYVARFLAPWRDRIETWVRAGGRLLINVMPATGSCDLPFGLVVDGDRYIGGMCYLIYDSLPMTPTPIMGPSDQCVVDPALGVANVASANIRLFNENAPKTEYGSHSFLLSDGGAARFGNFDGWVSTDLGWNEGHGMAYHSYSGPYIVVSKGAGSIACVSYRPPSQLSTSVASPTIFWQRMLLWAFRPDGFGLVATEDWRPSGVVDTPSSFSPAAKTYGVRNLGDSAIGVTVSTDVDWIAVESDSATLPAGSETSFRLSLSPEAWALPTGTYTGTVSFASSRDFCHEADVGGWGTLTYPAPEFRRQVVLTVSGMMSPVYRFYSPRFKGHFFTIDENEKDNLIDNDGNWDYEGVAYCAFTNEMPGTVALHRFYSPNYRGHFFTIDENEKADIIANNWRNWNYEGIAYYVYPSAVAGALPVYRFWSARFRHHFYTIDENEKENIRANDRNWEFEGPAFWALPAPGAESSAGVSPSSLTLATASRVSSIPHGDSASTQTDGETPLGERASCPSGAGTGGMPVPPCQTGASLAPWSLAAQPDGTLVALRGETDLGDVFIETRGEAPEFAEMVCRAVSSSGSQDSQTAGIVRIPLRLSLPEGLFDAQLWSLTEGLLLDETSRDTFDFELPADGAWRWIRIFDEEDEDAFSLWLRAEELSPSSPAPNKP